MRLAIRKRQAVCLRDRTFFNGPPAGTLTKVRFNLWLSATQSIDMKILVFVLACMGLIQTAQARESRQEVLQTCAKQAKDKELAGDAYADFMRACLKPPEG